jgi:hypothetical protein
MQDERWEFRVWTRTEEAAEKLARLAPEEAGAAYRTDTYLLISDDRLLVKIRSGQRFEVKRLLGTDGSLQHWRMECSLPFPLSGEGLPAAFPERRYETPPDLFKSLGAETPIVPIRKHRRRYVLDGAEAEVTSVISGQARFDTVGIEAPQQEACRRTADLLGIGDLPNTDYGAFLRSLQTNNVAGNSR